MIPMTTTTDANAGVRPSGLPAWAIAGQGIQGAAIDQDDGIDSEVAFEPLERAAGSSRGLPLNALQVAREAGAGTFQLRKAEEMERLGLSNQAKRQALCGVVGMRQDCSNTDCGQTFFQPFHCKCRYCLMCGGRVYRQLFRKHAGLLPVAEKLLAASPNNVVAKLDFTTVKLGRMPTRDEVRAFNECIKRFCQIFERELRISRKEYGLVYCDEFGGNNNNLHAHALYVGPKLPRPKIKGRPGLGKLALWWRKACEGTAFHGSFIISIKRAKNFEAGLAHALKYAGKFLSTDPARLASLELAFHRVRRVHTLAAFYNAVPKDAEAAEKAGPACPKCGSALKSSGPWLPIVVFQREGRHDLDEARRTANRMKVFGGPRDG